MFWNFFLGKCSSEPTAHLIVVYVEVKIFSSQILFLEFDFSTLFKVELNFSLILNILN